MAILHPGRGGFKAGGAGLRGDVRQPGDGFFPTDG